MDMVHFVLGADEDVIQVDEGMLVAHVKEQGRISEDRGHD